VLRRTDRAPDHFWPTRWTDDPGGRMHVSKVSISNIGLLLMSGPFCVQNPPLCGKRPVQHGNLGRVGDAGLLPNSQA